MAKKKTENNLAETDVKPANPKIHLTKYVQKHPLSSMEFAFIEAKHRYEMHTPQEWKKLIQNELSRKLF